MFSQNLEVGQTSSKETGAGSDVRSVCHQVYSRSKQRSTTVRVRSRPIVTYTCMLPNTEYADMTLCTARSAASMQHGYRAGRGLSATFSASRMSLPAISSTSKN